MLKKHIYTIESKGSLFLLFIYDNSSLFTRSSSVFSMNYEISAILIFVILFVRTKGTEALCYWRHQLLIDRFLARVCQSSFLRACNLQMATKELKDDINQSEIQYDFRLDMGFWPRRDAISLFFW